MTAWFKVARDLAAKSMSPDLLPAGKGHVRARIRFYDLAFERAGDQVESLAPVRGRFREGVVAFAAKAGPYEGETSLYIWTDSEPYLLWGREVFGWPLLSADIHLEGPLWTNESVATGAEGRSVMHRGEITLALEEVEVLEAKEVGLQAATWITPRRILRRAGLDPEVREVLLVRPDVRVPGQTFRARGRAQMQFPSAHPLHQIDPGDAEFEVVDGLEIIVGASTEVL